jgi:4-hydroxy-tetrahydrodipicolinate synthase
VTPFGPSGQLDAAAAVELARWLGGQGTEALVVAGSTGEATVLSDEEKIELWTVLAQESGLPVIAAAGTSDTRDSCRLAQAAQAAGAAGLLVVTPYYSRPSQAGLEAHFRAVAGASSLPVILYDIPIRTGRRIAPELLVRLGAEVENIIGVKDSTSDAPGTARLAAAAGADFEIYSGEDAMTLSLLAAGARGAISVESHWAGPVLSRMVAAFSEGKVVEAAELNFSLLGSHAFQSSETAPNPIPAKAMLRAMGFSVGQCRLPLGPAPAGLEEEAKHVLAGLGVDAPARG